MLKVFLTMYAEFLISGMSEVSSLCSSDYQSFPAREEWNFFTCLHSYDSGEVHGHLDK